MVSPVAGVERTVPIVDEASGGVWTAVAAMTSEENRRNQSPARELRIALPHRASRSASLAASHVLASLPAPDCPRGIHPGAREAQVGRRATRAGWRT
jgi:hypothetical protein